MDRGDGGGAGEDEEVVVAAEVARPVSEPFAAVVAFGETELLDLGAHAAVEHNYAAVQLLE